jgi:F-type H+-transporting ATPase subunit a
MEIHISIAPEVLFTVGPVPVTNSMLTMFIVMGLILIAGAAIARGAQLIPGRWQSLFEVTAQFILDLVESTGGKTFGRRLFPLIGAIFIFIALANYTGVLPGVGTIGFYRAESAEQAETAEEAGEQVVVEEMPAEGEGESGTVATDDHAEEEEHLVLVPLFRAPNADLNMTLAMALVTFTTVQVLGIRAHGVGGRIKHMADPPFIFPIEVVSELGRIVSLSARLFGNVLAGEVLLAVMYAMANALKIAIIPLLFPVVFIVLELLFGTIQALVFALLTAIYIVMAASGGHDDHEHAAHAEPDESHVPERAAPAAAGD